MNSLISYSNIILAIWIVMVVYWVATAWGNKRTAYRFNPKWRLLGILLVPALYLLFSSDSEFLRTRLFERTTAIMVFGTASCAAGVAFAIWARRTIGTNWSANPTIKEGHELVEFGPYRLVRHPIYSGLLLAVLGSALAGGEVRHAFIVLVAILAVSLKMRIEETLMMRQFPEAYADYRTRTKALIPFVI
jgi:protein-S-isoprenylcysteine O-methyltransferase Ste14